MFRNGVITYGIHGGPSWRILPHGAILYGQLNR